MYKITIKPEDFLSDKSVYDYRFMLKRELLEKRGYKSDWSGKPISDVVGCHMHESIVTRACVPKGIWWHLMIFAEPNCLLLLPEEHEHPPSREWAIQWAYEHYGRDVVRDWFYSLPFRSYPFQLL